MGTGMDQGTLVMDKIRVWQERVGHQRAWVWRGLQLRYSFWRSPNHSPNSQAPIVLIHGFGAAIEHWRDLMPLLAGDRPVYAVDLLGFGGSRKGTANFGVPLWRQQLEDFLNLVVQRPVILMGNSIGSLVCAAVAAQNPKMVTAIALLSVPDVAMRQEILPPVIRPLVNGLERLAMQPWLLRTIFNIARRRGVLRNWLKLAYPSWSEIPEELLDIVQAPTLDADADAAFIALSRRVGQPEFCASMADILPQILCPILMLWGEQDKFVPVAIAASLASHNPKTTLHIMPNLGHCPHDEAPAEVYRLFSQWLEQTSEL